MHPCPDCGYEAKSKGALTRHQRAQHADPVIIAAAKADDRVSLLRELVVELATKVRDATPRELPAIARQLTVTSGELEKQIGAERALRELRAELERRRKERQPAKEEASRVDEIAEKRARRRAKATSR